MSRINTFSISTVRVFALAPFALTSLAFSQTHDLVPVVSKPISRMVDLPGEFLPFLSVSLHAKVPGYVERILVDRGSRVDAGQLLAVLSAPEMGARIAEGESKVQAIESDLLQGEAQLSAAQSTYDRLKKAAQTPGAIAGNEIIQAEKQVEAAQALIRSREQAKHAAEASVNAEKEMQSYLQINAPFDGVVTERLVHPGALVGPGADPVLLILQQISRMRLVVAVPEEYVGGITEGAQMAFQVPAYPERTYSGTLARVSHSLDKGTRTMAVELDITNRDGLLAPGMYPSVKWPIRRSRPALFVPRTSVVTTTERTFVIRNQNGRAEWVDVRKGAADGDLIEVLGDLKPGDLLVRIATDEIREGSDMRGRNK
jgi:membrane fusion protein (multidrug efflux system)